jgi:short-subunit dehydrogenase
MKIFKTILITGASSGLGHALAELYAAPGVTLLLTGRNAQRTKEVADACRNKGATVEASVIDVTDRDVFEKHLLEWDDKYKIDLVIANAGISGGMGRDSAETENIFREIMRINLDGTFNTVNPLIPRLQARGTGQIVLMSSMAGFRGLPSAAAYSVSKNAVRAYGEALRPLLKPHGIGVNVVCPGFIKTPMTDVNDFPMPFLMEVDEAARRVQAGIEKNKPVIAFPLPMFLLMEFLICLPRRLGDFILSKAPKKP